MPEIDLTNKTLWRVKQSTDLFHTFHITPEDITEPDYSSGDDNLDDDEIQEFILNALNGK